MSSIISRRVRKLTRDLIMVGVFVLDAFKPMLRRLIDPGVGIAEQDGGVGGDDQLRASVHQLVDLGQEGQLPRRRQCSLRFVQDIEAVTSEPVVEQSKEAFAMRLFMQGFATIGRLDRRPKAWLRVQTLNL